MKTTGKSRKSISFGVSTNTTQEPSSKSILCRHVMLRAIRDAVGGTEAERKDVIRWLASPDFPLICGLAGVPPDEWRRRIADLFRQSTGLRVYYANKMIEELRVS